MRTILLSITLLLAVQQIWAQGGVGINNTNAAPDNSAMLDVSAIDKGFLAPRMTMAQRDAIMSPATGLFIFQTDNTPGFYYYDGTTWSPVSPAAAGGTWGSTGNDAYNTNSGNVGIGTTTPTGAKLNVEGSGNTALTIIDTLEGVVNVAGNFTNAGGLGTGTSSAPATIPLNVPPAYLDNLSNVRLDLLVYGDLGDGAGGGLSFGNPVDISASLNGISMASNMTPPGGASSGCTPVIPTALTPAGQPIGIDVTAIALGQTSLTLVAEDQGGSYRTNSCPNSHNGATVLFRLIYTRAIPEPAIAVGNGTLQLTDFAGNGTASLVVDNQGDLQFVSGGGPLMVRNPDGSMNMQNYIEQPITIGGEPWDVVNPGYLNGYSQAILEVRGGTQRPLYGGNIREYDSTGVTRIHSNGHISPIDYFGIHADFNIAGGNFFAHSDARIKNVIGTSKKEEDLALLNTIKITDYKYIDTKAKGDRVTKKVIAQELRAVYPEAVTLTSRVIPNIYQQSAIKNGWIDLARTDLKVGEPIEYYTTKGDKETRHTTIVVAVEKDRFRVAGEIDEKDAFIYGKMVNDFHVVDYDALTTLNISATQALLNRVEALEKENAALKAQNESLNALKAEVASIKALLNSTSSK